ncbi:mRNA decay activator protein ZFP36L1 isoform X2 [Sarcophilus harrisii]|uniref:mRNA decay activator protein ZFP36L1 isoform X2 n=1 Tax=Sarcophilus harrisii TaxID=9305 RepID=UPI001301DF0B|nr:mRNA decay activator protein ZFP36L1 isoform X2 [Sarcophilus harrisii]
MRILGDFAQAVTFWLDTSLLLPDRDVSVGGHLRSLENQGEEDRRQCRSPSLAGTLTCLTLKYSHQLDHMLPASTTDYIAEAWQLSASLCRNNPLPLRSLTPFMQNNKMLNYSPSSPGGCLLDRKAVGTPAGGGFPRRHSVTLPSSKFHQNQLLSSLKAGEPSQALSSRDSRFRDRSFSEGGERLLPPQKQPGGGQVNSSRYKTELCRPFEENGACKYGDKCQFAHGIHELRSLTRHPKYKTELCRTFHTIGFCPYGPRCHFIHNAEERRALAGGRDPSADRPRLHHSFSFSGFPSAATAATTGLLDSPTSITPPPILSADDLLGSPTLPDGANNPFAYSSQELASLFAPSMGVPGGGSPTTFLFRPMSESPHMFDSPPSPQDSLSDQEGYLSSSSSSHSGSDSPILDNSRRLPIFSRLSISDD